MAANSLPKLCFRIDPAWTPEAIEKARAYDLARHLGRHLCTIAPHLLPYLSPILDRFSPVRLGHGKRMLRAWGRNYTLAECDKEAIELLVNGYYQGARCVGLPANSFKDCQAIKDGIIRNEEGMFWLEEPKEEKERPVFVMFPELVSSNDYAGEVVRNKSSDRNEGIKAKKRTKALMCLYEHPDWNDSQIAKAAGCDRASLYRMKGFKEAKAAMRAARNQFKEWNQGECQWEDEN